MKLFKHISDWNYEYFFSVLCYSYTTQNIQIELHTTMPKQVHATSEQLSGHVGNLVHYNLYQASVTYEYSCTYHIHV